METKQIHYTIEEARAGKGPFIKMTIVKTKVAPLLQDESILLYLPINGTWQQLTDWPEPPTELELKSEESFDIAPEIEEVFRALPPDERDALRIIWRYTGGVSRKEIDSELRCSESKSLNVIKSLIDRGLIIGVGEGKGRIYKPRQ